MESLFALSSTWRNPCWAFLRCLRIRAYNFPSVLESLFAFSSMCSPVWLFSAVWNPWRARSSNFCQLTLFLLMLRPDRGETARKMVIPYSFFLYFKLYLCSFIFHINSFHIWHVKHSTVTLFLLMQRWDRGERQEGLGKSLLDGRVSLPASMPLGLGGGVRLRKARHSQTEIKWIGNFNFRNQNGGGGACVQTFIVESASQSQWQR